MSDLFIRGMKRGNHAGEALREKLDDTTPVKTDGNKSTLVQFFEHPLIDSLFPGE